MEKTINGNNVSGQLASIYYVEFWRHQIFTFLISAIKSQKYDVAKKKV